MSARLTSLLLFTIYCGLHLMVACVSRTTPSLRFTESASLSPPTLSVPLSNPDQFSFVIDGDLHFSGSDVDRTRRIIDAAKTDGDEFLIGLGDIADKGELSSYTALKDLLTSQNWSTRFLPVIGNHDIFEEGWTHYRNQLGATHYTVTIGNCRFLAIDTADGMVGSEEAAWLEEQLKNKSTTHTFIISHYMPIIPGVRTYLRLANEEEALRLMKMATKYGVKGWFGAHYHSYLNETIDGVDYVVAGGAGGRRMPPIEHFFYVKVTIDGNDVSYQLKPID